MAVPVAWNRMVLYRATYELIKGVHESFRQGAVLFNLCTPI